MRSRQTIINISLILIALACGYYYRDSVISAAGIIKEYIDPTPPCEKPVTYSLGSIDPRFGMSTTTFLRAISDAEVIWEDPSGKNLFEYVPQGGNVIIDLVYDYRQKATTELARVDEVIQGDKAIYNNLKSSYASLMQTYAERKASIDALVSSHAARATSYETQVNYWNARGGAPKSEYTKLEQERLALNAEVDSINQEKKSFNSLVESINSTAAKLNQLAQKLNINVRTYNTIGSSAGEEFSEGEYIVDGNSEKIIIYQYDSNLRLVRVLAHELGHALGLDHVSEESAIMYRLNNATGRRASAGDIVALTALCTPK